MIYFTSDLHLGHRNIIKYCNRPFRDIHEMNKCIIDTINNTVNMDDSLYILGDFAFRGKDPIEYRNRIICKDIHVVVGNHDREKDFKKYLTQEENSYGFSSVQDVKEIIHCNQKIFLSHYPHRSWPASHKGSYHLYGHVHSKLNEEDRNSKRLTLDVGVDNTANYGKMFGEPWSFRELQTLFKETKT
jgi:calcineurin-like phosphoesterase family protein